MLQCGGLTKTQAEALDAGAELFQLREDAQLTTKILVEFKNGVDLSLFVTPKAGGLAVGEEFGEADPEFAIVTGMYYDEVTEIRYPTAEAWCGWFIPQVEARPQDKPDQSRAKPSGNRLYAKLQACRAAGR